MIGKVKLTCETCNTPINQRILKQEILPQFYTFPLNVSLYYSYTHTLTYTHSYVLKFINNLTEILTKFSLYLYLLSYQLLLPYHISLSQI
jgi:hypothetical protein